MVRPILQNRLGEQAEKIMYTLNCLQCKQPHPRADYRKRGGGLHKLCPVCRKKEYNERAKLRQRIKANKETLEQRAAETYIKRRVEALTVEFNRVTRTNRTRIRILTKNEKPTKTTTRNLAFRQKQQERWALALSEMLKKIRAGERIDVSLREYYSENVCTDM